MKHNWGKELFPKIVWFQEGPGVRNTQYRDTGVKLLNVANLVDSHVDLSTSNRYISEEEAYGKYKHFLVDDGDFIIASSGIQASYFHKKMGFINKTHLPLCMNTSTIRFKVLDDSKLNIYFFQYYLKSFDFNLQLQKALTGCAQLNFGPSHLKKMKCPLPPMVVQEHIVAELDKINETIEDCRELLRNLDALKLSLFYDYFGDPNTNPKNWNISTFGEIGTFIRGGGFLKRDFVDFGIPCIHYGQIHTKFGEVVRTNLTYISEYTALKSKFAKPNDVILAITSEDLEGSCKSVAWLGDFEVAVGGHAAIFTHNQNPVFISFYTRSNAFCIEKEKYAYGSKVVEIRPKDIEKIPIYLPPLSLQEKFAERIEQIEAQKKVVESTIAELQTLLDSRMDYWFN